MATPCHSSKLAALGKIYCQCAYEAFYWKEVLKALASRRIDTKGSSIRAVLTTRSSFLARERIQIRKLLRAWPIWSEGHLYLAACETLIHSRREEKGDVRGYAAARVSIEAYQTLSMPSESACPMLAFVESMLCYFEGDEERAKSKLQSVVKEETGKLDLTYRVVACESLSAIYFSEGNQNEGVFCLRLIPESARSAAVVMMLNRLR